MNAERARAIFAAYGADQKRWPEAERAALLRLLMSDPALRASREEARALDLALGFEAPAPSEAFFSRVAGMAPARAIGRATLLALAASALFGLAIGVEATRRAEAATYAEAWFAGGLDVATYGEGAEG